jgi:sugar lactone lactonase YvrE
MKKTARSYLLVIVAGLAAVLAPINIRAAPGDLYETDIAGNTVYKFAQDGTKSVFTSGIDKPYGLAFDGSGNLFVGESGSGTIFKFRPDGTRTTFISALKIGPLTLAFDSVGNLFVAEYSADRILKFTPGSSAIIVFASGLSRPSALAVDKVGNVYETDFVSGAILKFTPAGTKSSFATGLSEPVALAFDSAGNLFETDRGTARILKFAPDGTRTTFTSGLSGPEGLAFDSAGNLFEADSGSGTIFIFTPAKFPFATGVGSAEGLAFEPTRHQFLNVSTRGLVGTGDDAMIGGFIVNGNGKVDDVVIVRAIGPTLAAFSVPHPLLDPTLELHDPDGVIIATNDNWKTRPDGSSQEALIVSTGVAPTDNRESAIYATLPAGHYTAVVRGAGSTTGIAVVEVYNLQN